MLSPLGTGRLPRRGSTPLSRSRLREPKAGPEPAVLEAELAEGAGLVLAALREPYDSGSRRELDGGASQLSSALLRRLAARSGMAVRAVSRRGR